MGFQLPLAPQYLATSTRESGPRTKGGRSSPTRSCGEPALRAVIPLEPTPLRALLVSGLGGTRGGGALAGFPGRAAGLSGLRAATRGAGRAAGRAARDAFAGFADRLGRTFPRAALMQPPWPR